MPKCDYCSATFDDEEAYLDHLEADHQRDLSAIDEKRVEQRDKSLFVPSLKSPPASVVVAIGLLLVASISAVALGGIFPFSGNQTSPTKSGTAAYPSGMSGALSSQGKTLNFTMICNKCGKGCAACKKCPDVLANATDTLTGVFGAHFRATGAKSAAVTVAYDPEKVSKQEVATQIKSSKPYPACCTDLSVASSTK